MPFDAGNQQSAAYGEGSPAKHARRLPFNDWLSGATLDDDWPLPLPAL
jgi:hypothetical protein